MVKINNIIGWSPDLIMRKKAFLRTVPAANLGQGGLIRETVGAGAFDDTLIDPPMYDRFCQADFLREFDPNAHAIRSIIYYPNPFSKDSEGKLYAKMKSRVAVPFQERIFTKRLTALTGNNIAHRLTASVTGESDQKGLGLYREGWEEKDMEVAIHKAIAADLKVADTAFCGFIDEDGKFDWTVFSYENGDILYPQYGDNGRLVAFGRKFCQLNEKGEEVYYLDVWDKTYHMQYMQDFGSSKGEWKISMGPTPHGFPFIPIAYDRYGEPCWAKSQSLIEAYELAVSQFSENNAAYALRILYTMGGDMEMSGSLDGTPNRIDSSDPNAKVGFLEPADSSASFEKQLDILEKNIMRSSFAVETPEIKSGSDLSSLTVKMLFADAYHKALEDAMHFQPFLDSVSNIFKFGYGVERGMSAEFESLRIKCEIIPFIFQSETEVINAIVQLKGIGVLSTRTATEIAYQYAYGTNCEYERILKEEHDALIADTIAEEQAPQAQTNPVNELRNQQ